MSNYAPIPIIDRMSGVLEAILRSPNGLRPNDLLQSEGIPKTTLYRLLTSMTENGFLTFLPDSNTYTLGPKFTYTYASLDAQHSRLREAALPHLRKLADQSHETIKLTVLSSMQSHTIATMEGQRPLRVSIDSGALFPLHAGAAGKCLMLAMDPDTVHQYYKYLCSQFTEKTIMTPEEMLQELESIRRDGYAIDRGEYAPEIRAVAAPVKNAMGQIIASISVAYPVSNLNHIDTQQLAAMIIQTANAVTESYTSREVWNQPARLVSIPTDLS